MRKLIFPALVILIVSLSCTILQPTPTPDLDATLNLRMAQTQTAQPTATSLPTASPTALPTATPLPTNTPLATNTPHPTETSPPRQTPPPFSKAQDERGWTRYTYHQDGFSLAIPPNWTSLNLKAEDYQDMLAQAKEANPELDDLYSSKAVRNMVSSGVKFIAIDVGEQSLLSGFPTNLNLLITDLFIDIELDNYIELNIMQIKQMFGPDLEVQQNPTMLNGEETVSLTYSSSIRNMMGVMNEVQYLQYFLLAGDKQMVLTFTTLKANYPSQVSQFQEIAASFQYGK